METGLRILDFDAVRRSILLRLHDTRVNKSGETRGKISESCVEGIWKRACRTYEAPFRYIARQEERRPEVDVFAVA